jgi:hypothetical protein
MSEELVIIYFLMLLVDFLLGIAEAKATNQEITSNKAKNGIIKKLTLFLIPFVFVGVLKGAEMQETALVCVRGIMAILIASEGYSIL